MTEIQIFYDGPIVKRSEAKAQGLKRYFTGKPCKRGHVDERMVSDWNCASCNRVRSRKYREENPDKANQHCKKWYNSNIEFALEKSRSYRKNNLEKYAEISRNRRALEARSEGTHTKEDVIKIYEHQNGKCAEPTCQKDLSDGYHVDHIMPLSKGGSNWPRNLQCLCQSCNNRKHAKHPIDWALENGRLC